MPPDATHPDKPPGASGWQSMWLVVLLRGLAERLIAAQIVTNSLVLAAQTFLALFPLIILVYALIPPGAASGLVKVLRTKVGITGNSGDAVLALFQDRSSLQQGLSVASGLLVLGSATAFTRALQRVYEGSWAVPKLGLRGVWRWVAWLAALGFYLSVVGALIHLIGIHEIDLALQIGLAFLFWWWSPFLLLGGRVCWRALIPGAVITTVSQVAVTLGSTVVMPRLFRSNEADYGPIGVVFALETWLVVVAGVLVVGAALGALVGQSSGRFGRWLVGNDRPEGWRRQPRWGRDAAAAAEAEARGDT